MHWRLILEEFGPNIQHISEVENIVADTLSRLTSTYINDYKPSIMKAHCRTNELLSIGRKEKRRLFPPKPLKCANRITKRADKS